MSDNVQEAAPPPSYEEAIQENPSDVIPPSLLSVDGQSITAQGPQDETPTVVYQLNRGIASLSHATSEVKFERLVTVVSDAEHEAGGATSKRRRRHVYNLKYIHKAPGGLEGVPSDSPHYYVEALSSRTKPGSLGIKKATLRKQWKAIPLDLSGKTSSYKLPQFIKNANPVFILSIQDDQYTWADAQGSVVAEEVAEDDEQSGPKLQVKVAMPRESLDMLVALWCCHVWQQSADGQSRTQSYRESSKWL